MLITDFPSFEAELEDAANCSKNGVVSIDTETTSLNLRDMDMVGMSFAYRSTEPVDGVEFGESSNDQVLSFYYPTDFRNITDVRNALLDKIFNNELLTVVFHNALFDLGVFDMYDMRCDDFTASINDTMIMSHVTNENRKSHGLKQLTKSIFNVEMQEFDDMVNGQDIRSLSSEHISPYACDDAKYTYLLYEHFIGQIEEEGLESVLYKIELPLLPLLVKMKKEGVQIDVDLLDEIKVICRNNIDVYRNKIITWVGRDFNVNSPVQLGKILFEEKGIAAVTMTPTGRYQVNQDVLNILTKRKISVAGDILKYRWYTKMDNTFLSGLTPDGSERVYPNLRQVGTATGRFSSTAPNEQNITVEDEVGLRGVVIPYVDDNYLLVADYSQIELRLLAIFSGDHNLIQAFSDGADIHQRTADLMGVTRSEGKTLNFAILYGLGANALSQDLNITKSRAYDYINGWFSAYPGVKTYKEYVKDELNRKLYVTTMSGRRRRLPGVRSEDEGIQYYSHRQGFNSIIQGSAADLMKLAMKKVYDEWNNVIPARIKMSVHDELVVSLRGSEDECTDLGKQIVHIMETSITVQKDVPIVADSCLCSNWWFGKYDEGDTIPDTIQRRGYFFKELER